MKKLAYLTAILGLFMFRCSDDLQNDVKDLKSRVDSLENAGAVVSDLSFQGNDLVMTFSDGSSTSVTVPDDVLPGNVVDFGIDNQTHTITVNFADGSSKEYLVLNNDHTTYLSGTLTGDYGITSITMGDVKIADLSYDDQNRMVKALINLPDGNGNVINVAELQNNYSAADPTMLAIEKAMYPDFDYTTEEYINSGYAYFNTDKGYNFVEQDGNMYTLYRNEYYTGTQYRYDSIPHCWFVPDNEINNNTYDKYYPVPGEDSLFYQSYNNYTYMDVDGVSGRVYYPQRIIRIDKIYQAGETLDTAAAKLTMRPDDLIEKVEMLDNENNVSEYQEMTYDQDGLLTQVDMNDIYDVSGGTTTDTSNYGRLVMSYTNSLLSLVQYEELADDGSVTATTDMVKFVYDEVGNPTEIWVAPGYDAGDGYNYTTDPSGKIIISPLSNELQKVVGIEYDYTLPNFFGKTLEYMIPELKGLKIKNAPVRLTHSGFFDFVNMEYFDFNQSGYPAKVKMEAYISSMIGGPRKKAAPIYYGAGFITVPVGTEAMIEYTPFQ